MSDFVLWGDSLTTTSLGYGGAFASLFSLKSTYIQGDPGQVTSQITARTGGTPTSGPISLTLSGNTIPVSGSVSCTPSSAAINPFANWQSNFGSMLGSIAGTQGILAYSVGTLSFTPLQHPASPVTVSNPVTFVPLSGQDMQTVNAQGVITLLALQPRVAIYFGGRNDMYSENITSSTWFLPNVTANIAAAVSTFLSGKYIVVGIPNGEAILTPGRASVGTSPDDAHTVAFLQAQAALNAALKAAYGANYFDLQAYLESTGQFNTFNLLGNNYNIINTTVMPDGVHFTGPGYQLLVAQQLQAKVQNLGYGTNMSGLPSVLAPRIDALGATSLVELRNFLSNPINQIIRFLQSSVTPTNPNFVNVVSLNPTPAPVVGYVPTFTDTAGTIGMGTTIFQVIPPVTPNSSRGNNILANPTYNIIQTASNAYSNTISGGGTIDNPNMILDPLGGNQNGFSTIGGGYDNVISTAWPSIIGGGAHNRINTATNTIIKQSNLTGTVSSSGAVVTGSGTNFLSVLVPGSVIGVGASGDFRVSLIFSNTSLLLSSAPSPAWSAATAYASNYSIPYDAFVTNTNLNHAFITSGTFCAIYDDPSIGCSYMGILSGTQHTIGWDGFTAASCSQAVIAGGTGHVIMAQSANIGGGAQNAIGIYATGSSTIAGGSNNTSQGNSGAFIAGNSNYAGDSATSVLGSGNVSAGSSGSSNNLSFYTLGTGSVTSGTFTLTYNGQTTSSIAYNATPAAVQAALGALNTVGTANVRVWGAGAGTYNACFYNQLYNKFNSLTGTGSGLTMTVSTTSPNADGAFLAGLNNSNGMRFSYLFGRNNSCLSTGTSYGGAVGFNAMSYKFGHHVNASGMFARPGDAQNGKLTMFGKTTDATATSIFLDGSSIGYSLLNASAVAFNIRVTAFRTDSGNEAAAWFITGMVKRISGTGSTTLVGTPSGTGVSTMADTNAALWTVGVTATSSGLVVTVTGAVGKTIQWVASIDTTETAYI